MKKTKIIVLVMIVVVSFMIYAGHFLLYKEGDSPGGEQKQPEKKPFPVEYRHFSTVVNGNKQEINILNIDLSEGNVKIKPVLSYDSVFGFEKLSSMALRSKAYAAVNAGFFYQYGQPSGMVVIDGRMFTNSSGKYAVFSVIGKKAELKERETRLWLSYGQKRLKIDKINSSGGRGDIVVYTPDFGGSNRSSVKNITVTIEKGRVRKIAQYNGKVDIPDNGMLLTIYAPYRYDLLNLPIHENDSVEFVYEPYLGADAQAYECGSWIVRDGKVVIGKSDPWVGVMTNRDPRTAIGIKSDGTVVLLTVDGRQPGYSAGLTGKELGRLLLEYGVVDAAMLDGGASTEMIIKDRIVNRPSHRGQERPVGGGIIITVDN